MTEVRYMLETAKIYLEYKEPVLALHALEDAMQFAQAMRPTRRVRIVRAHIAQCIERTRRVS